MNMPTNTKPWIQGAVVGAIAAAIVGFSWGGWVTGGTATKNSVAASHDAVVAALAPICVERFRAQPDALVKADALVKTSTWERGDMIAKSGFRHECPAARRPTQTSRAPAPRSWRPPGHPRPEAILAAGKLIERLGPGLPGQFRFLGYLCARLRRFVFARV